MQNKKISIKTKNNLPEEIKTKELLEELLAKYPCPIFTDRVIVEKGARCYSGEIIILNTNFKNLLVLLEAFVHEQFHGYFDLSEARKLCVEHLKSKYNDLGDCGTDNDHPDAFWEHLAVIWNVRNFLSNRLAKKDNDFINGLVKHNFCLTEKFVADNFEQLRQDLEKFNMAYKRE